MVQYKASIILNKFELNASIGIHDFEKKTKQRLIISVELFIDHNPLLIKENIEQTVNYDFLRDGILKLSEAKHYNLQETLCYDIAQLCLAYDKIQSILIYTQKPDVYPDCESIGFKLHVTR
jgi:dihydroneopterin aldolase